MIIFDLDGTLADCEHRRHFVDPSYNTHTILSGDVYRQYPTFYDQKTGTCIIPCDNKWKPDWKAFYEACDEDTLIIPVAEIYSQLWIYNDYYLDFEIWSGRCESVRKKTEKWLLKYDIEYSNLKMRPTGDNTPDDQLKEKWLDEAIADGKIIDMVFDDRPKVVRMWRRRGIFVFDVNQSGKEF